MSGFCVAVAVIWAQLAAHPVWPVPSLCVVALVALYFVFAPLRHWWPFGDARSAAEMLDECIQQGYELRRRIMVLDHVEAGQHIWAWTLGTANSLQKWFPAALDEFFAAQGDQQQFYGSRLAQATLNARVVVLQNARGSA
jgi:hypothetical protein